MLSQGGHRKSAALAVAGTAMIAALVTSIGTGGAGTDPTTSPTAVPTTTAAATAPADAAVVTTPAEVAPTTIAGPTPRPARRIATAVDTEKIRPASLPFRAMGIGVGVAIVCLAVAGFIYGKVRSRLPTVALTKPVATAPAESHAAAAGAPASELPPPTPMSEWAPPSRQ